MFTVMFGSSKRMQDSEAGRLKKQNLTFNNKSWFQSRLREPAGAKSKNKEKYK